MKERERRGKPRHAAVVAADMQPSSTPAGAESPIAAASYPSGAPNRRDGARPLAERASDVGESCVIALSALQGEREGTRSVSYGEGEVGRAPTEGPHLTPTLSPHGAEREAQRWRVIGRGGVAEGEQQAGHVVVVFGGRRGAAGDPVEDVGVGAVEQRLVAVELRLVKPGEMRIGKAAEDQVALARAAVPGAEQQPLAANLG